MSWTVIAFIVLIFGMMAWPIVLLKPNTRQQQQIALRQQISKMGITIQVTPPRLPDNQQQEYNTLARSLGFSRTVPNSVLDTRYCAIRSQYNGDWFWLNSKRPPAALMQAMLNCYNNLPDYCLAVEQGTSGSTVFALESRITPELLPPLLDTLNALITRAPPTPAITDNKP